MWNAFNRLHFRQIIGFVLTIVFVYSIVCFYPEMFQTYKLEANRNLANLLRIILIMIANASGAIFLLSMITDNQSGTPNLLFVCLSALLMFVFWLYYQAGIDGTFDFSILAVYGLLYLCLILPVISILDWIFSSM